MCHSTKFSARSSLLLCPLTRINTVITDDGICDRDAEMRDGWGGAGGKRQDRFCGEGIWHFFQAAAKGDGARITVIAWDSGIAPEGRMMPVNPSSTALIGNTIIKLAADNMPEGGEVAILSASATATNQNIWI